MSQKPMPDEYRRRKFPPADAYEELFSTSQPTVANVSALFKSLQQRGETVRDIGHAFDLSSDALAAHETFEQIEATPSLTVDNATRIGTPSVRNWFKVLGSDLSIDLSLEDLDPTFFKEPLRVELRAGHDPLGALKAFLAAASNLAATQGDSISISARLSITKTEALRTLQRILEARAEGVPTPVTGVVFYSAAACERTLTLRAAPQWRERGLGVDAARLCVIICDSVGALAGPALEIIGAASAEAGDEWLPVSRAAWRRFVERASAARRLRDAESAWSGLTLALLPDHLRVVPRAPGLERIAGRLQALRAQVAACALASHVERGASGDGDSQGDLTLRFAGARPALARLTSAAPPSDLEAQPRDALIDLADWAYRDASPDKLAIARQALADTLTAGATLSLAQLCVAAAPALDTARANFAIYLRGATERYFQLRASAQQTVSGFADATRAAVASLTSDVTDNLFRTVGLIVGVAIAWLIQPSASLALVRIAAALYTLYVVFIVVYLLRVRQARYHLERKGLDDTLAAMSELTQAERERLRAPAHDAETHFESYYRLTCIIYFIMAGIGALLFVLLFTPLARAIGHP